MSWDGQGLHSRGNFEAFTQAASREKWLEAHGHEHWTTFYTDYGCEMQLRFFDHYLKGEDTWKDEPRVRIQVCHPGERFVEKHERDWPLSGTEWTKLYLDARDGGLSEDPVEEEASASYKGMSGEVTFLAPAREKEVEITGPVAAKLYVSSETEDADLFLIVRLFDSEGDETLFVGSSEPKAPVAQGWLRASHRKLDSDLSKLWRPFHTHDERQLLVQGEVYELDVEIWPTSMVVPPDYRLALTVKGSDFDHGLPGVTMPGGLPEMLGCSIHLHDNPVDRPPAIFGGEVTLYTGGDTHSHLLVPVIPAER